MKVAVSLAKNILAPSVITANASALDARIQKTKHCLETTILLTSNQKWMT